MEEHLYESPKNPEQATRAAVVLPEIFGMNKFITSTTDRLAEELEVKAFALDHFFPVTGKSQVFGYDDHQKPMETMQQLTGKQFMELFKASLDEIQANNPGVQEFIVVGFCFGGKLSFLAATDKRVTRVCSFYGSGSVNPGLFPDKSPIQMLAEARGKDTSLSVLGLFGETDPSIPAEARAETKKLLTAAEIAYEEKVYATGHAFMNFERDNMYSEPASKQAWADITAFLSSDR